MIGRIIQKLCYEGSMKVLNFLSQNRQIDRQIDKNISRQIDRQRDIYRIERTFVHIYDCYNYIATLLSMLYKSIIFPIKIDIQIDRQIDTQIDRQIDRWIDIQKNKVLYFV